MCFSKTVLESFSYKFPLKSSEKSENLNYQVSSNSRLIYQSYCLLIFKVFKVTTAKCWHKDNWEKHKNCFISFLFKKLFDFENGFGLTGNTKL